MRFDESSQLRLTQHAYHQYRHRVEPIGWYELIHRLRAQIANGDFYLRGREFVNLAGVWWVYKQAGEYVYFVTCYGRSHLDLPCALRWAARHRDRIVLGR